MALRYRFACFLCLALPSLAETASRADPVWVLVTDTFASLTIAPDWSATRTTIVDVFGDCASVSSSSSVFTSGSPRSL